MKNSRNKVLAGALLAAGAFSQQESHAANKYVDSLNNQGLANLEEAVQSGRTFTFEAGSIDWERPLDELDHQLVNQLVESGFYDTFNANIYVRTLPVEQREELADAIATADKANAGTAAATRSVD